MSSEMASSSCHATSERKMAQLDTALSALEGLSLSVSSTLAEGSDGDGDSQTVSTPEGSSGLRSRSSRSQSALDLAVAQEKLRRIFPSIPQSLRRKSQLPKNVNCRCRCHEEVLTGNTLLPKSCSQCVKMRQHSPWRYRPYIGARQSESATSSNSGGKLRRPAADKSETSQEEAESLKTLMAAAKATEFEVEELNLTLRSSTLMARSSSSCGAEAARSREDRVTVDELAAYFDEYLNLPRKMSPLAESMYA